MSNLNTGEQDQLSNSDDSKREADKAAKMTANLESLAYGETSSDVVADFAKRFKQAQQTPEHIFVRAFDVALASMDPKQGEVQYYQVYGSHMAPMFLDSLPGLEAQGIKKELERTWFEYLSRNDSGGEIDLDEELLPPWLKTKLARLREQLGSEYSIDLVAGREAGQRASQLTIDLRIEHKGSGLEVTQPSEETRESTIVKVDLPADRSDWELEEYRLRILRGLTPLEISIEQELRQSFDVSTVVDELKKVREGRLKHKDIYKNRLGDIDMGEVRLAVLDIKPPATDKRIIWASRLAIGGFLWSGLGFTFNFSPVGVAVATCLTLLARTIGDSVADLATSSAKDNFQPWNKSPRLHELGQRLEAEGFKCTWVHSPGYPKTLLLRVSCRDNEASVGGNTLRLK